MSAGALLARAGARTTVAVGQMTSINDAVANYRVIEGLAARAVRAHASMLFLPECFHFFGAAPGEGAAAAEPLDGPAIARYCELAKANGLWLSLGGFQERRSDAGKASNTHVVITSEGVVAAVYRKVHLFDLELPDVVLKESAYTEPGRELVAVDTPVGRLGLTTCYDVRFPAAFAALVAAGCTAFAVPSAFTVPTGMAHWEVLLRARAIETQAYVFAAAQVGRHNDKRTTYGHAMVVDPWGCVVAQCSGDGASGPALAIAEIDLALPGDVRRRMPVAAHMRPDVYAAAPTVVCAPAPAAGGASAGAVAGGDGVDSTAAAAVAPGDAGTVVTAPVVTTVSSGVGGVASGVIAAAGGPS